MFQKMLLPLKYPKAILILIALEDILDPRDAAQLQEVYRQRSSYEKFIEKFRYFWRGPISAVRQAFCPLCNINGKRGDSLINDTGLWRNIHSNSDNRGLVSD